MRRHFTVILSILLALAAASPASAARLKKNNVENIAAREEQEAMDAVSGPAAGEAAGEEALQAEAGGRPGEVTGNSAPEKSAQMAEAPEGEEQGTEAAEETKQSEEPAAEAEQETEAPAAEAEQAAEAPAAEAEQATEAPAAERGEKGTYLGSFTTTGYSNPDGSASADGTMPRARHTVSADWKVLPPGTRIRFGDSDIIYTVEDTGVHGNWVDVYYPTHSEAWSHGLQYKDVYLVD